MVYLAGLFTTAAIGLAAVLAFGLPVSLLASYGLLLSSLETWWILASSGGRFDRDQVSTSAFG